MEMGPANRNESHDWNDDVAQNERILLAVAMSVAVSIGLASYMPGPLIAPVVGQLLFWGALASAAVALACGHSMRGDRLTLWDQALILCWLSLIAQFFTDPDAASAALESVREHSGLSRAAGENGVRLHL